MNQSVCSLPIYFSVKNEVPSNDGRFLEVEIDVLHEGLNLNNSIFSKKVVDENIDTIKNTPILGFIRELPDGEKDFKGHEYIITKTDNNGLTKKYIGSAFGLIPESCDARWITKISEDGLERNYLRVNGLLWTKFSDSIDIIMRDIEKPHSMELYPDNIDGYEDSEGHFIFTSFNFDGCCILGSTYDIQPAMISSDIKIKDYEINFSISDFVKNIQSELINKCTEFSKLVDKTTNTTIIKSLDNKSEGGNGKMSFSKLDFAQTAMELFSDISAMVKQQESMVDRWGDSYPRYYLHDIQDDEAIVVDRQNNYQYFGFKFTINGDKPEIDFSTGVRKKTRYENYEDNAVVLEGAFDFGEHIAELEEIAYSKVTDAENKLETVEQEKATTETEYAKVREDFEALKVEHETVNTKLQEIEPKYNDYVQAEQQRAIDEVNAQKDAKFEEFEAILSDVAEFTVLKEKKDELTVEEIENKCAVMFYKKQAQTDFSKNDNGATTTRVITDDNDDKNGSYVSTSRYGNIKKA